MDIKKEKNKNIEKDIEEDIEKKVEAFFKIANIVGPILDRKEKLLKEKIKDIKKEKNDNIF